jgi:hypothetical protein
MTSIYDRTGDLFAVQQQGEQGYLTMKLGNYYNAPTITLTTWMPKREAQLMLFAIRRRVADFAIAQRRSKARLADVVALEARR